MPDAALAQVVDEARRPQRDVDVAVSWRAPLELPVLGPLDRREVVDPELGLTVLQEVQRQAVDGEPGVALEDGKRLLPGAEGVHEQQWRCDVVPTPQGDHLAGDDVEEGETVADGKGGLRPADAHARPQPAVELDDHGARQGVADRCLGGADVVDVLHLAQRRDGVLRDRPRGLRAELRVEPAEHRDRELRDTGRTHLGRRCPQSLAGHDDHPTMRPCPHLRRSPPGAGPFARSEGRAPPPAMLRSTTVPSRNTSAARRGARPGARGGGHVVCARCRGNHPRRPSTRG